MKANEIIIFIIGFIMWAIVSTLDYNIMMLCK